MYCRLSLLLFIIFLSGCVSYRMPGAGVALETLAQPGMAATPAAQFPARIALLRLQATGYEPIRGSCPGTGRYCVVTALDMETPDDLRRLQGLPLVDAVERVPEVPVPERIDGIDDLRAVLAGDRADMLLLYSLDTRFRIDGNELDPSALTRLAFSPGQQGHVTSTATAVLVDARSGFVYGKAQARSWQDRNAVAWSARKNIIRARETVEREAFGLLLDEFDKLWQGVVRTHGMRGTNRTDY